MPQGDIPHVYLGAQEELKRLFYSDPNQAFAKAITIPPGYGIVKAGAVRAKISEGGDRRNQYIPYVPFDSTGMAAALTNVWGLAYLTAAPGSGSEGQVTMDDSWKFRVDDYVTSSDSDQGNEDLGQISAIDRTTYAHIAAITVGGSFDSETLAKGAAITIQSSSSTPYVDAVGILKGTVDTGVGENAKGGIGALVIKHAMLYKDSLYSYNADVLTDLGGSEDGRYLII